MRDCLAYGLNLRPYSMEPARWRSPGPVCKATCDTQARSCRHVADDFRQQARGLLLQRQRARSTPHERFLATIDLMSVEEPAGLWSAERPVPCDRPKNNPGRVGFFFASRWPPRRKPPSGGRPPSAAFLQRLGAMAQPVHRAKVLPQRQGFAAVDPGLVIAAHGHTPLALRRWFGIALE
jgi:hypothetical protein